MILDKILKSKVAEVAGRKSAVSIAEIKAKMADTPAPLDFAAGLKRNNYGIPAVIAEVKKASPSKGLIRPDFDPQAIAKSYQSAGASAISVLTDEEFFQGCLRFLRIVKQSITLPVIRKDFIIDEYQIFEARAAGVDAILLIVAALSKDQLIHLNECAKSLGMAALVEVHNEAEMETALNIGAGLLGINNRNLYTFDVTLETTKQLIPMAKNSGAKIVSESGIFTREDMQMLGALGADAVLIGEALMREQNIESKLRELIA